MTLLIAGCGGSGVGDAQDIAVDSGASVAQPVTGEIVENPLVSDDPPAIDLPIVQDDLACKAEIDIAEFFLTEADRQWSCSIESSAGFRFDDVFFDRRGTALFANDGIHYWNRNPESDSINLAAPGRTTLLMTDIASSNTTLMYRTVSDTGAEELYECLLVTREMSL